jgi:dGTPase
MEMTQQATAVVTELFERFMDDVHAMPKDHAGRALDAQHSAGDAGRARAVADYVAGMTDRYALSAYARLVGEAPDLEMRAQIHEETP